MFEDLLNCKITKSRIRVADGVPVGVALMPKLVIWFWIEYKYNEKLSKRELRFCLLTNNELELPFYKHQVVARGANAVTVSG
jgi:hypothetical protein